ncbi:hypothetical protein EDC94DRAFT_631195 [Helicostylum pulchrum]|nr:hypothetical protein EDC94DRAFT_631195 [Helicostylum pulchrum]
MTDQSNANNEHLPRTYTEEEHLELFQRFRQEEQTTSHRSREERELPMEITTSLESITMKNGLWEKKLINRLPKSSKITPSTLHKWSTRTTKGQKLVASMDEQQLKSLNNSAPSNLEAKKIYSVCLNPASS